MNRTVNIALLLLMISSYSTLQAAIIFDNSKRMFVDETIVHKKIIKKTDYNDKVLKFEQIKIQEHKLYDLKELEPEPLRKIEIEAFKEMEIIDISKEIGISKDDFDSQDGKLYISLFFSDKKNLTYQSKQKLKKLSKSLEGIDNFKIRIESNYYSLKNNEFNYTQSIVNGQGLKSELLLNTYVLENDIEIIPFGDKNKICTKNIPQCLNANTRIELFITLKK